MYIFFPPSWMIWIHLRPPFPLSLPPQLIILNFLFSFSNDAYFATVSVLRWCFYVTLDCQVFPLFILLLVNLTGQITANECIVPEIIFLPNIMYIEKRKVGHSTGRRDPFDVMPFIHRHFIWCFDSYSFRYRWGVDVVVKLDHVCTKHCHYSNNLACTAILFEMHSSVWLIGSKRAQKRLLCNWSHQKSGDVAGKYRRVTRGRGGGRESYLWYL